MLFRRHSRCVHVASGIRTCTVRVARYEALLYYSIDLRVALGIALTISIALLNVYVSKYYFMVRMYNNKYTHIYTAITARISALTLTRILSAGVRVSVCIRVYSFICVCAHVPTNTNSRSVLVGAHVCVCCGVCSCIYLSVYGAPTFLTNTDVWVVCVCVCVCVMFVCFTPTPMYVCVMCTCVLFVCACVRVCVWRAHACDHINTLCVRLSLCVLWWVHTCGGMWPTPYVCGSVCVWCAHVLGLRLGFGLGLV